MPSKRTTRRPPTATNPAPTGTKQRTAAPSLRAGAPDDVLLAIVGMSPAVLTETIWALAQKSTPVIPRRVVVVTTTDGRLRVQQRLFTPLPRFGGRTPWEALRSALQAEGHSLDDRLQFGPTADDIRVITTQDPETGLSRELSDIRTPEDNEAAADFFLEQVRQVVENPDTRLIASVAGGRKTMGALLYACLTLIGRKTDFLTHVLVSEPYEALEEFYFRHQPGGDLTHRDGRTFSPDAPEIQLADVLFVPLRDHFTKEMGRKAGTFSRLVAACRDQGWRQARANVRLSVARDRCEIGINGTMVRTSPQEHLVVLCLATRGKDEEPALDSFEDAVVEIDRFRALLAKGAPVNDFADWRHKAAVTEEFGPEAKISKVIRSLRDKLVAAGGQAPELAPYLPQKGRFSLDLDPANVEII